MIRILGFLAILVGTTGCGLSIIKERKQEVQECKEWLYILSVIENEMSFQKSTLPEICFRISRQTVLNKKKRCFFKAVYNKMQQKTGEDFANVWKKEFVAKELASACHEDVREELKNLGERIFFEDITMQKNVIKATSEKLDYYVKRKQKKNETENKVVLCMSVMSGILITILLV